MAIRRLPLLACLALLAALAPAWARAELVTVKGKVTLNGQPLPAGKVLFHLDNGKALEIPIKDGSYSSDKVPVGQVPITVQGKGVPARYTRAKTTPLRAVIKKESNQIDITLVK